MKTTLFLTTLYMAFGFFACNNRGGPQAENNAVLEFTKSYGLSGFTKSYRIKDGKLYRLPGRYGTTVYKDTLELSAAQWEKARPMLSAFPAYLEKAGSGTYGCPGCTDNAFFTVVRQDGTGSRTWTLDLDTLNMQAPVKDYVLLANRVVEQL